jgi:DNA-directed RNA polymerase sigma subunit (sigma70/sigma32)
LEQGQRQYRGKTSPSLESNFLADERHTLIDEARRELPGRSGSRLAKIYGWDCEPMSLEDIGRQEGVSRQAIDQGRTRALRLLRQNPILQELVEGA